MNIRAPLVIRACYNMRGKTVYAWNSASLCGKIMVLGRLFHKPCCVARECQSCGLETLKVKLEEKLEGNLSEQIRYYKWEKVKVDLKGAVRTIKQMNIVTIQELIDMLIEDSKNFANHLHTARWQQMVYDHKRNNPSTGEIICLSDPSENHRNEHQVQPSSVHWSYSQLSVCPVVLHYLCPNVSCKEVVKEVVICCSGDLKHDAFFAQQCESMAVKLVEEKRHMQFVKISKQSEGAPCTYKSKYAYYLQSLDQRIEKSIFGANHGKNLADGEGAVAKTALDNAVKSSGVHIDSAADAVKYLESKWPYSLEIHSTHSAKSVLLLENINREIYPAINPIKGIQKTHFMKTDANGNIFTRKLACCCPPHAGCQVDGSECPYEHFVGKFTKK
jgi:hypothetical protein